MPELSHNNFRNLVWNEVIKAAKDDPGFREVVTPIGFFSFMTLVDGIVDAVLKVAGVDVADDPPAGGDHA